MSTMRGGGIGLSTSAERSPRAGSSRANRADLPKLKPSLKKLWPQIRALVGPRKGLLLAGMRWMAINLIAGMGLMAINIVAGLVLPFTSNPLLDKVLSPINGHPEMLPRIIVLVFSAMIVQAITS